MDGASCTAAEASATLQRRQRGTRVVEPEIAELLDPEIAQHPGQPVVQVRTLVDARLQGERETGGEETERTEHPPEQAAITEPAVVQGPGDVIEP